MSQTQPCPACGGVGQKLVTEFRDGHMRVETVRCEGCGGKGTVPA